MFLGLYFPPIGSMNIKKRNNSIFSFQKAILTAWKQIAVEME